MPMLKVRSSTGGKSGGGDHRPTSSAASIMSSNTAGGAPSFSTVPTNSSYTTLSTTSSTSTSSSESSRPGPPWVHSYAPCRDGSRISYYTISCVANIANPAAPPAPSILISHGPASYALTHQDLAAYLSQHYTCHTASRRGRGFSDPWPDHVTEKYKLAEGENIRLGQNLFPRVYDTEFSRAVVEQEIDDLEALIAVTNPDVFFGVSTAATVALLAVMAGPTRAPRTCALRKFILYEPLILFTDRDFGPDLNLMGRYEREMAAGRVSDAMCTGLGYVGMVPKWLPRTIMRALASVYLRTQDHQAAKGKGSRAGHGIGTVGALAPLLRYDFAIVNEALMESSRWSRMRTRGSGGLYRTVTVRHTGDVDHDEGAAGPRVHKRFASRTAFNQDDAEDEFWHERIILLSGEKGPKFLQLSSTQLAAVLPGAYKRVLPGWGHEVLCNETEVGGTPSQLVPIMREIIPPEMFARHDTSEDDEDDNAEHGDSDGVDLMV
jgi:pimeloyl-ACP methyl ester carboxylesterase